MSENNFNQLTPAELERLALLSEECGEVIQIIGKIFRHGYESCHPNGGQTNRELLEKEIGDVNFAISLLADFNKDISPKNISGHVARKKNNIQPYLHHNKV